MQDILLSNMHKKLLRSCSFGGSVRTQKKTWHGDRWWGMFVGSNYLNEERPMNCPHCASTATKEQTRPTSLGYRAFRCSTCKRIFNERTGTLFNYLEYPTDIILLVVLWRLRYKLSLRDLAEMFLQRGFVFTHEAVRDWEARFASLLERRSRNRAMWQCRVESCEERARMCRLWMLMTNRCAFLMRIWGSWHPHILFFPERKKDYVGSELRCS
jgi:hypothetical protein